MQHITLPSLPVALTPLRLRRYDILGLFIGNWYILRVPKILMAFRIPFLVTRLKNHLERHHVHLTLDAVMMTNLVLASVVFVIWISCGWGMLRENLVRESGDFVASIYWVRLRCA